MPELYRGADAETQPGEYVVRLTEVPRALLLDGDEPPWREAAAIAWGPPTYRTRFRALYTGEALAIRFDAADHHPWFTRHRRDDCLWEEEVVEIFLDPTCSGRDYLELEISPNNVVCDLHIARLAPERDVRLEWDFASIDTRVHHRPEVSWTAVAWLPFADFAAVSPAVSACLPVGAGDVWHFNVFRIKRPHGPAAPEREAIYAAWSVPDATTFHTPDAFRPLRFGAD